MTELVQNVTFDEIEIGQSAELIRTVTKEDIELYAVVSGDANPTHLDEAVAREAKFAGIVAHGMLTAGLISNLLGNRLPGAGTIYVAQDLQFAAPVHAGDTVTVRVTAKEKRAPSGIVLFDCRCVNQDGVTVLHGTATVKAPKQRIARRPAELPALSVARHDSYRRLIEANKAIPPVPCAVAHPCERSALQAALDAWQEAIITPILVGPLAKIRAVASELGAELTGLELIDAAHSHDAAAKAVELVRAGRAELLMKGSLHTDELMSEIVKRDTGIRTERRLSHVFLMDVPTYPKPLFITDAAINIFPTLEDKVHIVQNAIDLFQALGLGTPRVAIVSAVETVNPKIPSTVEAAALCKMAERGQITGALLDGPLALDNAISEEAARIKKISSEVAGRADILLVPDLEAGNMVAKNLSFLANADAAGIVLGARVPVILTSRADTVRAKMASCAVAALYAHARRTTAPLPAA
jgi:phosphotransacetylase/acyl dehydratase